MIDQSKAALLEVLPSDDEITTTLKRFDPRKSPGYDSFNVSILLKNWEMIADEVIGFVKSFFRCGKFPTSINTWVTLIPTWEATCNIDDFRLVSMVGYLYKIISKVFVRRLRSITGDVIFESQIGFVHDRNISDGLITTYEAIN